LDKTPISWARGTWDYSDKANMGFDAIPTVYDASVSGYATWKSGVGWGSDLYLSELVASGYVGLYDEVTPPEGDAWLPRVDSGYFYIGIDEYYLYSSKGTTVGAPSVGRLQVHTSTHKYPPSSAPLTLTLGTSEFSTSRPFSKTYEPTPSGTADRTPTKYRRRYDTTGRREYAATGNEVDGIVPVPYSFQLANMQYTMGASGSTGAWEWYLDCLPSGNSVTAEYETSNNITYDVLDVDMNPFNSYEVANSFLAVVDSSKLVVESVVLDNGSRYCREATKPMLLIAAVKDKYGCPISGEVVTFAGAWGTFSDSTVSTIWDGTAATWFIPGATINVTGVVTAVCAGVTGSLWVPTGRLT
jgi:hypothetical protein